MTATAWVAPQPGVLIAWVAPQPGAPLGPIERPIPSLGPDNLLVEVEAAVFGAPEVRAMDEGRPVAPGSAAPEVRAMDEGRPVAPGSAAPEVRALDEGRNVAPGSAAVGRVVATGAAARHRLGERVLVGPVQPCGECDVCRRGHPAVCPARRSLGLDVDGTLATHVLVRARVTLGLVGPLAGAVPGPEAALLPREAALAYELLVRCGVGPGETTVWLGGGPIATLGQALARARSATAFAPTADERALPPEEGAAALRARIAEAGPALPLRIFEVSGRTHGRVRAAALAGPGSTLGLLAPAAAGVAEAPPLAGALLDLDLVIVGVAGPHPDLLPELCALAVRGELDLAAVATIRPWADVPALAAELRAGGGERAIVVARG